ncbi:MAG: heavy-metal-associated domain-containing protein [Clostridia bacterium]|nr:heavy-metal-associated domain-containing protein [Clostridia bacterium]
MIQVSKQSAYFRVPDLSGSHDVKAVKQSVDGIPGVISVSINAGTNKVAVDYDSTGTNCDEIREEIEKTGHLAQLLMNQDHTM